jgi:hypothetical protein
MKGASDDDVLSFESESSEGCERWNFGLRYRIQTDVRVYHEACNRMAKTNSKRDLDVTIEDEKRP